jgi:phosphoglycerol transferase MdoB-like AlkP superfamily enzyme
MRGLISKIKNCFLKIRDFSRIGWVNNTLLFSALILMSWFFSAIPELLRRGFGDVFWGYYFARPWALLILSWGTMLLFYSFLTVVLRRIWISTLVLGFISFLVGFANNYKMLYRDVPVIPADIYQIEDALFAAQSLDIFFKLTRPMLMIIGLILLGALLTLFVRLPQFMREGVLLKKLLVNVGSGALIAVGVVALFFQVYFTDRIDRMGYQYIARINDTYYQNTFYVSFFVNMEPHFVPALARYSQREMALIGSEISALDTSDAQKADIILVTVESWFWLDNFEAEYEYDPFQNFKELEKEATTGNIVSPLYGGGTADIEFELLTGLSTGRGKLRSTAFNLVMYPGFPGIVNYVKGLGYHTISLHSHTSELYNRPNAYRMLGFDESYFSDSIESPELSGPYIKDSSCFEKLIELYESSVSEHDNTLIHTLTMQNHMHFNSDRYPGETMAVTSERYGDNDVFREIMPRVATSFAETDQAIADLIDYFRTVDRDVIIILLGDHQTPQREYKGSDILTAVNFFDSYNEETDFLKLHTTPYLVWTNFADKHTPTFGNIPPNMLLTNALSEYDVVRPAYFEYLLHNTTTMNGMTSNYVVNPDGSIIFAPSQAQQPECDLRDLIEYDIVTGKKYLENDLYG